MAIQIPNPGTGNGASGDNEFVLWSKVKDNFSDQTNAASKLIGSNDGEISLNKNLYSIVNNYSPSNISGALRTQPYPSRNMVARIDSISDARPVGAGSTEYYTLQSKQIGGNRVYQYIEESSINPKRWERVVITSDASGASDSVWKPAGSNLATYVTTTATAPNMVVEADGTYKRASSSARYKDIISSLELDSELYQKAMQVNPIVYRSKADGDPKDWHYMSFLAEEIGELDPALTQWSTHGTDPKTGEWVKLDKKEAEGINLNAICAVLHATNIYQDKKIKELEQRLTDLESANEPIE